MNTLKNIFLAMASCLLATGCDDDLSPVATDSWQGNDKVTLQLKAADETRPGGSRSIDVDVDEGTTAGYTVKDFVIFQFDEKGNRIVDPQYYTYTPDGGESGQTIPVVLPQQDGVDYTIVVLANTHEKLSTSAFADATTLDRLVQKYQKFEKETDAYRGNSTDGYDLLMNGYATVTKQTSRLDITLFRNVAKFTLTITNPEGSGVTLRTAQVKSDPTKIDYFYHLIEDKKPELLTEPYPSTKSFTTFDYAVDEFSVAPGESKVLTYYLPAHLLGTSQATSEKTKGVYAPDYATFVELYGTSDDGTQFMRYQFHLGENLTNDYNIRPNYHYTLPLRFSTIGNPATDARLQAVSALVEEPDANCYILNPLPIDEMQTLYAIPVANRVNTFWQNEWAAGNVHTSTGYTITKDDEWSAEIIWQTSSEQMIEFCDANGNPTANDGRVSPVYKGNTALRVRPKKGVEGNVLVGVYRTDQTGAREYSWSWHLWITDYNPDECRNQNWDGRYKIVLSNGSGEVHRYVGEAWDGENAKYHNKWMMDRNIGAMSAVSNDIKDIEGLYYLFGRKDPFTPPKNTTEYCYNQNTDKFVKATNVKNGKFTTYSTIPYYVNKPYEYPNNRGEWLYVNPYQDNIWNDPDWNVQIQGGKTKKSFFDPCPPGWKLPELDVWDEKLLLPHSSRIKSDFGYIVYFDGVDGSENTTIYHYGWLDRSATNLNRSYVFVYSSTPASGTRANWLSAMSNSATLSIIKNTYDRTIGSTIRAIRE